MILRTVSESSTIITSGSVAHRRDRARAAGRRPRGSSLDASKLRQVGAPGELHRVDDQHDLAGAEHRGAGNAGHARELRPDVLHDDFLVADHLVDVDRRVALAAAQQQHRVVALRLRVVRGVAEEPRQVVERVRAPLPLDLALDVDVEQRLRLRPAAPARPSAPAAPTGGRPRAPAPPARPPASAASSARSACPCPARVDTSTRPPSAAISLRTTSMPMPRPEICVTSGGRREARQEQALDELRLGGLGVRREQPARRARSRTRVEVDAARRRRRARSRLRCRPGAPSARSRRFPTCPHRAAPRATRCRDRAHCAAGARAGRPAFPARSGRARPGAPWISRFARLSSSFAVARRIRYRRSDRLPNGTVRIENSRCCTSRDSRACASSAASASSRFLSSDCCTVETSLMPSASERVSSWKRV